jgi:membrane associated rhomboid family serine protease
MVAPRVPFIIDVPPAHQRLRTLWRCRKSLAVAVAWLYVSLAVVVVGIPLGAFVVAIELESSHVWIAAVVGVGGSALSAWLYRRARPVVDDVLDYLLGWRRPPWGSEP